MKTFNFISLSFLFVFYFSVVATNRVEGDKAPLVPQIYPPTNVDKFTLGFSNLSGDLYWLRVIQNLDYCENSSVPKAVNSGLGIDQVLDYELSPSRCNKGWVYQMLNAVVTLAPQFRKAYRVGGDVLSVAVDDREGARLIYEKGLNQFPDYWELAYSASYHYLFEFQNSKRAAELLMQAADSGGPFWFRQMAGTLFSRSGQLNMAEVTLKSYIYQYWGQRGFEQAKKRLKELYIQKGLTETQAVSKMAIVLKEIESKISEDNAY